MNNLITQETAGSYNTAVAAVNRHQAEHIKQLTSAINSISSNIVKMKSTVAELQQASLTLKKKVFINQALIDNVGKTGNYVFPTDILQ